MRVMVLPPTLLVVVALCQVVLAKTVALTPWKGGGFGMFSTLDHGAHRGVVAIVEAPERSETLEMPPSLEELSARAVACPSDWLLRELARGIVERERRYERPVAAVKITVWQTAFDVSTLVASERTLRTFEYHVP
jgi:hypothetical protein